jgi:hypothetical protein
VDLALRRRGDARVVGDEHDRPTVRVQRAQDVEDVMAGLRVEVAGRLVGEDDRRVGDDGPGDGDPLLLAAGQLPRLVPEAVAEAEPLEGLAGARLALAARDALVQQRRRDVLERRGPRQEVVGLEDEADRPAADRGEAVVGEAGDRRARELVLARRRPVEAAEDAHHRRLAGARGSEDGDELALVDRERDVAQGVDEDGAHVVGPADTLEAEQAHRLALSRP